MAFLKGVVQRGSARNAIGDAQLATAGATLAVPVAPKIRARSRSASEPDADSDPAADWGALDFSAITPGRNTAYFPRIFESAAVRY